MDNEQLLPIKTYNGNEPYIFISYAHKDADTVVPAVQAMQSTGCRVWFDLGIEVGTEWSNNIAQHLRDCTLFVAFISKNSVKSENCLDEISYAKSHQKTTLMIFLEEDVQMPEGTEMQTARFQRMYYNRLGSLQAFTDSIREAPLFAPCRDSADAIPFTPPEPPKKQENSNKKLSPFIWLIPAVILLTIVCVLLVPGLFGSDDNPTDGTEQVAFSDNLFDYCFRLEGKEYKLPFALTDLITEGWEIDSYSVNLDTMVKGLRDADLVLAKGASYIEVNIYNKSGHVKTVKDCMIGAVTVYDDSQVTFEIAKGITVESDKDAIIKAFGQPNFTNAYTFSDTMIYAKDEYSDVGVRFVDELENGQVVGHRIVICNEYRDGNPEETSTVVPEYLSDYIAPTELGEDIISCNVQIMGKLYHIPCPVQEFLDDGWSITSKPGYIAGCQTGDIYIQKDNARLSITLTNLTMTQTLPENCVVTTMMAYDSEGLEMVFPGGISYGMTMEELAEKDLSIFDYTDMTYSVNYDYNEYDPREMALYIQVNKEAGILNDIWLKNETWDYPEQ